MGKKANQLVVRQLRQQALTESRRAQPANLLEYVQQTGPFEVDEDNAVIKGVRILGLESANNRRYLREGVTAAIPLYEGKATNVDHPTKPNESTTVARRNGWLENVRQESDGGLRGDWHLLKSHPLTPTILEAARVRPQLMGLSHNASGRTRREGGREIVEAIDAVNSVDLVADPATVTGLHEGKIVTTTVKQLIESYKTKRPGYSRALREMAEAGLLSPDQKQEAPEGMEGEDMPPADVPAEVVDTVDHEQAILDAAKACIDDTSLPAAEKIAKIKKLLQMLDMAETDEGPEGSGEGEDDKKDMGPEGKGDLSNADSDQFDAAMANAREKGYSYAKESRQWWKAKPKPGNSDLREEVARLKARDLVRRIADAGNVKLSEAMLSAFAKPGVTEAEAKVLIDGIKPAAGQQPRSAAPQVRAAANGKQPEPITESSKRWTR